MIHIRGMRQPAVPLCVSQVDVTSVVAAAIQQIYCVLAAKLVFVTIKQTGMDFKFTLKIFNPLHHTSWVVYSLVLKTQSAKF